MNGLKLKVILRQVAAKAGLRYEEQEAGLVESWLFFAHDRIAQFYDAFPWAEVSRLEELTVETEGNLRYIDPPAGGKVLAVFRDDPRGEENPRQLFFTRHEGERVWIKTRNLGYDAWVFYRPPSPPLAAVVDDGETARQTGDLVYFDNPGDVYQAAVNAAAGSNPVDNEEDWTRVPVPAIAQRWLTHAIYADWLRDQGENDKAGVEERLAESRMEQLMENEVLRGRQTQVEMRS